MKAENKSWRIVESQDKHGMCGWCHLDHSSQGLAKGPRPTFADLVDQTDGTSDEAEGHPDPASGKSSAYSFLSCARRDNNRNGRR
jgi:hypothetical protein